MPNPIKKVTRDTYSKLGSAFIASNGGEGFLIAKAKGVVQGVEFDPTPDQWHAWLMYFQSKGIAHGLMKQRDYYTVPAGWPHLFDAGAKDYRRQEDATS